MKQTLLTALGLALLLPAGAAAQSAVDAYNITPTQQRGTARFISMGGAFTSLGGDISSMTQNPAGLGIYRKSDIGLTFDVSIRNYKTDTNYGSIKENQTKAIFDNIGYVGVISLSGAMSNLSWGVSYNRINSFERRFNGYNTSTETSLSNYIASYTQGVNSSELLFGHDSNGNINYNPYLDSDNDWLSILAYNSYMINPTSTGYQGLSNRSTVGDAESIVQERGYVDEYNIDFGGNVSDVFMWGIGFGITDLSYSSTTFYSESMSNATIASNEGLVKGDAGVWLDNWRAISGTGFNMKFGVIVKPIDMLRIGAAIHTPTWYSISNNAYAESQYSYLNPAAEEGNGNPLQGSEYTEDLYYNFHMNSPWKFMVGAAAVIGNSAIVSVDYERQAYNDIKVSSQNGWGSYASNDPVNDDIKNYFKAADIIRIGAEFRVTPRFSLRAGYNYSTSTAKSEVLDGDVEVYTAGMNPAYTLNRDAFSISVGLGYR